MDFSKRLDALQQRVAAARAAVQDALLESREQFGRRIDQAQGNATGPRGTHSSTPTRPPPARAASGRR